MSVDLGSKLLYLYRPYSHYKFYFGSTFRIQAHLTILKSFRAQNSWCVFLIMLIEVVLSLVKLVERFLIHSVMQTKQWFIPQLELLTENCSSDSSENNKESERVIVALHWQLGWEHLQVRCQLSFKFCSAHILVTLYVSVSVC